MRIRGHLVAPGGGDYPLLLSAADRGPLRPTTRAPPFHHIAVAYTPALTRTEVYGKDTQQATTPIRLDADGGAQYQAD